jgi:hypothetical protein
MANSSKSVLRNCKMKQWDDLKLFLAVAKSGTLTAAADELNLNVVDPTSSAEIL